MRRRDRMEGHIWLKWVNSETCTAARTMVASEIRAIPAAMEELVRHHRLMVVCDMDADRVYVRCYPAVNARLRGLPFFAASYSGTDLTAVLSAAAYEYTTVQRGGAHHDFSGTEVARWIA